MVVPKFTGPSVKFIRTLEGLLVVAANCVLVIVPIVTTSLSAGAAVKYGVILNSVTVVARSLLKAVMALGTVQPPLPPTPPAA